EPLEVARIEVVGAAQRESHPVQRDRIVGADPLERADGGPAAHVVLRMHLEPAHTRARRQDLAAVWGAQADAWLMPRRRPRRFRRHGALDAAQPCLGRTLPPTSLSQVPAGT